MSSRKDQKAAKKADRIALQGQLEAKQKRKNRLIVLGGILVIIVISVAVVLLANKTSKPKELNGTASATALLAGLPQQGTSVGNGKVTIEEFGDPLCPVCRSFSEGGAYAQILNQVIRTNQATFTYVPWAIVNEQSDIAAQAVLAAGKQNKGMLFVDLFYKNQGNELEPYVTDQYLNKLAKASGVDLVKFNRDRRSAAISKEVKSIKARGLKLGFQGTPSFRISGPNGSIPITNNISADPIIQAVKQVSGK
jgi:protein-disulfide isomerase